MADIDVNADVVNTFKEGADCERCGHSMDKHVIALPPGTTREDVEVKMRAALEKPGSVKGVGGFIICPRKGCQCYATWGFMGHQPTPEELPDRIELEAIRERLQRGEKE